MIDKRDDVGELMARLARQKEQEHAMAEVLPVRFERNMQAFREMIPEIFHFYKNYKPNKKIEFFCTDNGIPNIRVGEARNPFYGEDPYQECAAQVEALLHKDNVRELLFHHTWDPIKHIHVECMNSLHMLYENMKAHSQEDTGEIKKIPLSIMLGVGLGYQIGYMYERATIKNLIIVEPDLDVFYASLYCFDWFALLDYLSRESLNINILLGSVQHTLIEDVLLHLTRKGAYLLANRIIFKHYQSPAIREIEKAIVEKEHVLYNGWGFFDDNLYAVGHGLQHIKKKTKFLKSQTSPLLKAYLEHIPVFVIGNGPSLDDCIDKVKQLRDRVIIIACGTAISALHRAGIKPDIFVAVERMKIVFDFLKLIDDKNYFDDVLCMSVDVIHPDCHQFFKNVILGFKANEPLYTLIEHQKDLAGRFARLDFVNPMVGNTGLCMAIAAGFKNIYLLGLDCGSRASDHHHSKLSAYYNDDGSSMPAVQWMDGAFNKQVPANFGGVACSSVDLLCSAKALEGLLKLHPEVRCNNVSDGVLIEGAQPYPVDILTAPMQHLDRAEIQRMISEQAEVLPLSHEDVIAILDKDIFVEVVDNMLEGWRSVEVDRDAIEKLMALQFEYIFSIFYTNKSHIYDFLNGSLNYMFSLISLMIYNPVDDEVFSTSMKSAISEIIAFFDKAKERYLKVETFVDDYNTGIESYLRASE